MGAAAASGRFDDQLLTGPIDVCCARQQVGVVDAESAQGGLNRSGVLAKAACDCWLGCGRVLGARAGMVDGEGCGPGGGQHVAGGPDGRGRLADLSGCFGGGLSGVLAHAEQGIDMIGECRGEGPGDVHGVGQGPGGDQEPAGAGGGPYPFALGVGLAGQGVAGVVGGG